MTNRSEAGRRAHQTRKAAEAIRHAEESALRCFARATALMAEPGTSANNGEALFWGALGVLRIGQSDPELEAMYRAEDIIRRSSSRPRTVPGPYSGT